MKIFVTGHKGFIGQNLYNALIKEGHDIKTFDISDNVLRPKDLDIDDCDWVIHLGAISSTTETNIQKIMDLNLSWSIELFEECKKKNVNLQYASSASVYGNRLKEDGSFKETDVCKPLNYYAMSKYLFEEYVKKSDYDIVVQGFRYFNVYGPHEDHKGSQASPYTQFAKQAKETGIIKVFKGSEQCLRDFIHVDEVINVHLKMIRKDEFSSGIFNIGTGRATSFLEVARHTARGLNAKIEIIEFPNHLKLNYQYFTQADISKLKSLFYGS